VARDDERHGRRDDGAAADGSESFELREGHARVIGRRADLLMLAAVRNLFVKADLERNQRLLYAA
jgi:hypothetical protein